MNKYIGEKEMLSLKECQLINVSDGLREKSSKIYRKYGKPTFPKAVKQSQGRLWTLSLG